MLPNYPYSYLQKVSPTDYKLSVIIHPNLKYLEPENYLGDTSNHTRQLAFEESAGVPLLIEKTFLIPIANDTTVQVAILPQNGIPPWAKNTCSLLASDHLEVRLFPESNAYLPHLYFIKEIKPLTRFRLYVVIRALDNKTFDEPTAGTIVRGTKIRRINIFERDFNGSKSFLWSPANAIEIPFDDAETVEVVVNRQDGKVSKGTIRHSAADNKPYDLDDL